MSLQKMMSKNNFIFLTLSAILSVWLGFFAFDVPSMIVYYQKSVYWFLTISMFLWLVSLVEAFGYLENNNNGIVFVNKSRSFFRKHWIALLISLILKAFTKSTSSIVPSKFFMDIFFIIHLPIIVNCNILKKQYQLFDIIFLLFTYYLCTYVESLSNKELQSQRSLSPLSYQAQKKQGA